MARNRLPNRRNAHTVTRRWPLGSDSKLHVAIGPDASGRTREVFARAQRPDSDLDTVCDDAGVLLSLLLQHDVTLGEIAHSIGRTSDGRPASVIGLLVDVAGEIERELAEPDPGVPAEPVP